MPPDSSGGGGVDRRRQQNRDAQRRRRELINFVACVGDCQRNVANLMHAAGTALKLQIEELQAKNQELQTQNFELQTFKDTTLRAEETTFPLPTASKSPISSFFEVNSTREVVPGRPMPHQLSWNGDEGIASGSSQSSATSAARSSISHGRRQSLHDKMMGRIAVSESTGQFRNTVNSSLRPPEVSSEKLRPPALSLAGSSSDESTSPLDPGSYLDAASDTLSAMDIARPHSPSQSPLSNYFKTNMPMDASIPESWTSARIRPDPLPTRECLPWSDSFGVHKPAAFGQHAKQRALRLAVVNRQISSVELLIKYGADLNFIGDTGRTVLHDAAESNDGEMVQILLSRGANADLMDRAGMTALEVASSLGNLEVAEVLLKSSLG